MQLKNNITTNLFKIMTYQMFIIVFLITILLNGCIDKNIVPIPDGAYNVKRINLTEESATQINFKISVKQYSNMVTDYYSDVYVKKNWNVCNPNSEWVTMHEMRDSTKSVIEFDQYIKYLSNKDGKQLVAVILRQNSKTNQDVIVMHYMLDAKSYKKTLSTLNLTCN